MSATDLLRAAVHRTNRLLFMISLVVTLPLVADAQPKSCFPTCDERDARFLSLVGTNLQSLAGDEMIFSFRVPAAAANFNLEIFDGETGGLWDKGTNPVIYQVYADPDNDGVIEAGETAYGPFSGVGMLDNAWSSILIATSNAARLSASGPFFYTVRVRLQDASIPNTWSNFKLRANADILMQTNNFAFAAPMFTLGEAQIIYPNFDINNQKSVASLAGSTYDGTWKFFMMVEKAQLFGTRPDTAYVDIWDGDMDYGSYDCSALDTDDPNTPNAPFRPAWAAGTTAVSEGIASSVEPCRNSLGQATGGNTTGDPADDNINILYRRSPAINYVITAPDGAVYANTNPSGSKEWERFSASLMGGVPMIHDYAATAIPDGIYEVRIVGMDLNNLNAWQSSFRFVGVCLDGNPCTPPEECPTCPIDCPGSVATKGFWKNHPSSWPVQTLIIGGKVRTKAQLLAFLSATGVDKFNILMSQLVAAKLNIANGANSTCIRAYITAADAWVAQYEAARPITGSSPAWIAGKAIASKLDLYNNGGMCAPHRDTKCPPVDDPCDSDSDGGDSDSDSNGGDSDSNGGDSDSDSNGGDSDSDSNGGDSDSNGGGRDSDSNGGDSDHSGDSEYDSNSHSWEGGGSNSNGGDNDSDSNGGDHDSDSNGGDHDSDSNGGDSDSDGGDDCDERKEHEVKHECGFSHGDHDDDSDSSSNNSNNSNNSSNGKRDKKGGKLK